MTLNKLESELVRLIWVWIRLRAIYDQFPKLKTKTLFEQTFRVTIREDTIIQLHNFIKVRNDLIKHPKIKLVDNHLEASWKLIIELQEPIRILRNQYIAHIQEDNRRFKKPIQEVIDEYQVPSKFGEWLFRIGCCLVYCKAIGSNFKSEWDLALKKYQNLQPYFVRYGTIKIADAPEKIQEISDIISENLSKNGLKGFKKLS